MRTSRWWSLVIAACVAIPSLASATQLNTGTADAVTALVRAASYCVGQDYALDLIEGVDPSLAADVTTYRLRFEATYPGACKHLESVVDAVGFKELPAWNGVRAEIVSKVRDSMTPPRSPAQAKAYLASFQPRLSGDIEPLVFPYLLAAVSSNMQDPGWEIRTGWKQHYSTVGHAKSQGVNLQIDLPRSWKAEEGKRPHIVQKWGVQNGQGLGMLLVQVNDLEGEEIGSIPAEQFCSEYTAELKTAKINGAHDVKIEGQPAWRCSFHARMERLEYSTTIASEALVIAWRGKLVTLLASVPYAGVTGRAEAQGIAKAMLNAVGNTLVFPDRYK